MTTISFYFNLSDRLAYTCRLLRKAVADGARLVVTGADDTLESLDRILWTFSATEFLPHCSQVAAEGVSRRSPVFLTNSLRLVPHCDVLVNLGDPIPEGFERFNRVVEMVSKDVDERRSARLRWKYYAKSGFELIQHDLDQSGAS